MRNCNILSHGNLILLKIYIIRYLLHRDFAKLFLENILMKNSIIYIFLTVVYNFVSDPFTFHRYNNSNNFIFHIKKIQTSYFVELRK